MHGILSAIPGQPAIPRAVPPGIVPRTLAILRDLGQRHVALAALTGPIWCEATGTLAVTWGWRAWRNSPGARSLSWRWATVRRHPDGWHDMGWHPDAAWDALHPAHQRILTAALRPIER